MGVSEDGERGEHAWGSLGDASSPFVTVFIQHVCGASFGFQGVEKLRLTLAGGPAGGFTRPRVACRSALALAAGAQRPPQPDSAWGSTADPGQTAGLRGSGASWRRLAAAGSSGRVTGGRRGAALGSSESCLGRWLSGGRACWSSWRAGAGRGAGFTQEGGEVAGAAAASSAKEFPFLLLNGARDGLRLR